MKKIFTIALAVISLALMSCQKDPIGGTAAQAISGEWYVYGYVVDEAGTILDETFVTDAFGVGKIHVVTYNTSANETNQIFISDLGNFWDFTVKVACDLNALTFGNSAEADNYAYESKVMVKNGKITKDGAMSAGGKPIDAIEFEVGFDDDPYPAKYGYDHYKFIGTRYTGFVADE